MTTKTKRILVAEDEAALRDFVSRNLRARGFEVLEVSRRVREYSTVPIIVLTALDEEPDKVAALNLGADDYLTKPFGVEELLARVHAVLRRTQWEITPKVTGVKEFGDISIDLEGHVVRVRGNEVRLSRTEFALLKQLVTHAGKVLTHRMLLQSIWGPEYGGEAEYLRVYINRLRHKLEVDPANPRYLLTEQGVGYRFSTKEQ